MPGSPEYVKAWKRAHPERMHESYLRYKERYPEKFPKPKPRLTPEERKAHALENARRWRKNNPDKVAAAHKKWASENKERKRSTRRAWNKANEEHVRAKKREWTKAHPGSNNERAARWRLKNLEKAKALARETVKRWASRNPEKVAIYRSRSHAKRKAKGELAGTFTLEEWNTLLDQHEHRCACCGIHESEAIYRYPRRGYPLKGKLTVDHVIPLSKGGRGSIDNIAPLCLPCNTKKHAKDTDYRKIKVGPS